MNRKGSDGSLDETRESLILNREVSRRLSLKLLFDVFRSQLSVTFEDRNDLNRGSLDSVNESIVFDQEFPQILLTEFRNDSPSARKAGEAFPCREKSGDPRSRSTRGILGNVLFDGEQVLDSVLCPENFQFFAHLFFQSQASLGLG